MKKVFSVAFIAILSLTAILYSCQKPQELANPSTTIVQDNIKTRTDYGSIHNRVMEDVYYALLSNKDNSGMTQSTLADIGYNACVNSLHTQLGLPKETIESFFSASGLPTNFSSLKNTPFLIEEMTTNSINSISETNYKTALESILTAVDNASDYDNYVDIVAVIKANYNGVYVQELNVIASIATSSYSHWADNSQKWLNLNLQNVQAKQLPDNFKRIVKADVGGAISGALGGSIIPGAGTLAGACLNASFGSAAQTFLECIGWG